MPAQDTSEVKEKMIGFLRIKGPSLPVHIAKEIALNSLLTSVFLSELLSERRLKMSNMKIGSSSLYFIEGQELRLADFSEHLKSKEKDAFLILKEKRFLKDSEQEPAIRVALRAIKDFAIPFNRDGELIWRYFSVPESELKPKEPAIIPVEIKIVNLEEKPKSEGSKQVQASSVSESGSERKKKPEAEPEISVEKKPKAKPKRKKQSQKKDDQFFNTVKEFLLRKSIEILDIENFTKSEIVLRVKENGKESILIAYNKKKVTENDIIKAGKKSRDLGLPYGILSLGEPLKKTISLMEALKNLSDMKKIE